MKGIILAGGTGSRLYPLTKVTNKHLLPVGREPMIFHPLRKLCAIGLEEILIVTGVEHMGAVVGLLGSGHEFGCRLTYRVQDQAGGIAQALALGEHPAVLACCSNRSRIRPAMAWWLLTEAGFRPSSKNQLIRPPIMP